MNKTLLTVTFLVVAFFLVACRAPSDDAPLSTGPAVSPMPTGGMDHGSGAMEGGMGDMMAGIGELAALEGEAFEIAFLDRMIPHHRSALEMAQIALERGQRPEVREAAQAIVDTQEAEIAQMTAWLEAWYGRAPTGEGHGMGMEAEVEALRTVADEGFDVAFLLAMVPHHQGAIAMAELVSGRTTRPELLEVSEAIITAQQAEIAQFQAWMEEWSNP